MAAYNKKRSKCRQGVADSTALTVGILKGMISQASKLTLVLLALINVVALPVTAAPSRGGSTATPKKYLGYDISYPQCGGKAEPTDQAFGIVGVNGGKATTINSCLATQLTWQDKTLPSATTQPKRQVYVNTANPGQVLEQYQVTTWPTNNVDPMKKSTLGDYQGYSNPYGACEKVEGATGYAQYNNDMACSWQYGWNRAVDTYNHMFVPQATKAKVSSVAKDYTWWLDVETMNSWQSGSDEALQRNVASLEGMTEYYRSLGVDRLGIYSTFYQWGVITGGQAGSVDANQHAIGSNLLGKDSWLAGAGSESTAREWCARYAGAGKGFTGGHVTLIQFVTKNLDHNVSCADL